MVSEPLLWPFLCSLIFISVTPFFFQHRFRHHNNRRSLSLLNLQRHPAVVLGFRTCSRRCWGVSHCIDHCRSHHCYKNCSNYSFEATTEIILRRSTKPWKPQRRQRPHAPPRTAQSFCTVDHALHEPSRASRICHVSPRAATCLHAPAHASFLLLTSALGDIICYVIYWRHLLHICWRHRWLDRWLALTLTVDFFLRVDFFNPGSSYPVFRVDFIFAVCFCILCI